MLLSVFIVLLKRLREAFVKRKKVNENDEIFFISKTMHLKIDQSNLNKWILKIIHFNLFTFLEYLFELF